MGIFKNFLKKDYEELKIKLIEEYDILKEELRREKEKTLLLSAELSQEKIDWEKEKDRLELQKNNLNLEINKINSDISKKSFKLEEINKNLEISLDNFNSIELFETCGLYSPMYDYNTSELYKEKLTLINNEIKLLIKNGSATLKAYSLQFNNNISKGEKIQNDYSKLLLRAFNGEVDLLISKVK